VVIPAARARALALLTSGFCDLVAASAGLGVRGAARSRDGVALFFVPAKYKAFIYFQF
jgi:hypothetical protein